MNPNDERTEQLLTQALREEAADVQPEPGGLQAIQRRTGRSSRPRRRWLLAAGAASLATAAVVTGIVLVTDNDGGGTTGAPIVDRPREGSLTGTYRVWFYGPQPDNPEGPGPGDPSVFAPLYLEEHIEEPTSGSMSEQAVRTVLTTGPFDPDYASGWPSGVDVESITEDGGVTTIGLTGDADLTSRGDLTSGQANSAIQAMVRNADATGEAAFTYNGEQLKRLFGMPTPIEVLPYGADAKDSLRAPITVDIADGQELDNPVRIPVTGNVFEGTVNWQLLDDAGTVLDDGFVTAGTTQWATVDAQLGTLDPGSYIFRAFEVNAADGDEIYPDTKTFVVKPD
jgi:hypothetical protein